MDCSPVGVETGCRDCWIGNGFENDGDSMTSEMLANRGRTNRGRRLATAGAAAALLAAVFGADAQAQDQQAAPAPKGGQQQAAPSPNNFLDTPWLKFCSTDPQSKKQLCVVAKDLRLDTAGGAPIASVAVREFQGESRRVLMVAVPVGMQIQPGLRVQVDSGKQDQAKYSICFQNACFAEMVASDQLIASMKKGNQMTLVTINQQGSPIAFPVSLKNFSKVYDGPATDPAVLQKQQEELQSQLDKRAEAQRQKLIEEQKKATSGETSDTGSAPTPAQ